jgi:hypothetical protein
VTKKARKVTLPTSPRAKTVPTVLAVVSLSEAQLFLLEDETSADSRAGECARDGVRVCAC